MEEQQVSKPTDDNASIVKQPNKTSDVAVYNSNTVTKGVALGRDTSINALSKSLGYETPIEYFTALTKSSKNNIKTVEDALVMLHTAQDLGIGFTTALNNIHMIPTKNGITSYTGIHLIKAMLLDATNIYWEKIEDYAPVYQYLDEYNAIWVADQLPKGSKIVPDYNWDKYTKDPMETLVCMLRDENGMPMVVKYQTTYKFTRVKRIGNEFKTLTEYSTFSSEDVKVANLGNVHKMHPALMCGHRAYVNGARAIAADIILNLRLPVEAVDIEPEGTFVLDEDGNFDTQVTY